MKKTSSFHVALILAAAGSATVSADIFGPPTVNKVAPATQPVITDQFDYHHTNILGTSLDMIIVADGKASADHIEGVILAEIERLRLILSTYDPAAELAKLNASPIDTPQKVSAEIVDLLTVYDQWHQLTNGAFNGHLGSLIQLWQAAEKSGTLPTNAALSDTVKQIARPAWKINMVRSTVTRLTDQPINVDSLGKGYIVDKAVFAAQSAGATGVLVNLGGDIGVWGSSSLASFRPWSVGVADPKQPAENAAPLVTLSLKNQSVATSAAYERFYTIADKRYSHILDPRTGRPADSVLSTTVVASDNATANALATSLNVLSPAEGLQLVDATPRAECLIVATDGTLHRSRNFAGMEGPSATSKPTTQASHWPEDFKVSINIDTGTAMKKRPYVCVWVTDQAGRHIKTLAVWGNNPKYLKSMREWWKIAAKSPTLVKAVSRATRVAGKYNLTWDGADQQDQPVPQGAYKICLEVAVEDGPHGMKQGAIQCGDKAASGQITATSAFAEGTIKYGPSGR